MVVSQRTIIIPTTHYKRWHNTSSRRFLLNISRYLQFMCQSNVKILILDFNQGHSEINFNQKCSQVRNHICPKTRYKVYIGLQKFDVFK